MRHVLTSPAALAPVASGFRSGKGAHGFPADFAAVESHALAPSGEARRFSALIGIASAGGSLACAGSPRVLTSHDLIALPLVLLAAIGAALVAWRARRQTPGRGLCC